MVLQEKSPQSKSQNELQVGYLILLSQKQLLDTFESKTTLDEEKQKSKMSWT